MAFLSEEVHLRQGWGACGPRVEFDPREHLIWPAS